MPTKPLASQPCTCKDSFTLNTIDNEVKELLESCQKLRMVKPNLPLKLINRPCLDMNVISFGNVIHIATHTHTLFLGNHCRRLLKDMVSDLFESMYSPS